MQLILFIYLSVPNWHVPLCFPFVSLSYLCRQSAADHKCIPALSMNVSKADNKCKGRTLCRLSPDDPEHVVHMLAHRRSGIVTSMFQMSRQCINTPVICMKICCQQSHICRRQMTVKMSFCVCQNWNRYVTQAQLQISLLAQASHKQARRAHWHSAASQALVWQPCASA